MDMSVSREGIDLLGALTENGGTMFSECTGSFTKEVTVRFFDALQTKFGEELIVVLDRGTYLTANKIKEFAAESQIEPLYFSTGMASWIQQRSAGDGRDQHSGIDTSVQLMNFVSESGRR